MKIRTIPAAFAALLLICAMPAYAQVYNDFLSRQLSAYAEQPSVQIGTISAVEYSIEVQDMLIGSSAEIPTAQNAEKQIKNRGEAIQEILSIAECEALVERYYRMQAFDPQPALDSFERIRERLLMSFDEELFERYLEHAKLISVLYVYAGNRQCKKYDKLIQDEVLGFFTQVGKIAGTKTQTAALYVRYADYLYIKIGLPKYRFSITSALPVLYRKALMLDPDNIEATVKLACWHIFPTDVSTMNYNSYIELQENYIESLSVVDRFNAYLLYSTYYMRKYESDKGRAYLQKAAALFPDHVLLSHIYKNYRNGKFSL